jgi:signal transduction histidine kinase
VLTGNDFCLPLDHHNQLLPAFGRVFSNLFLNAVQAMPEGGTLTISSSVSDHAVVITVTDTGEGISAEMEEKLASVRKGTDKALEKSRKCR